MSEEPSSSPQSERGERLCYCGCHGRNALRRCSACYRCHRQDFNPGSGRNLVVCIDGTNKKFGSDPRLSNVMKLYRLAEKSERQLTYYNSGTGTYSRPGTFSPRNLVLPVYLKLEQAFGLHLESIVCDAHRWLSENYQKGDRIFLFGFSRGAYQVRLLSAMIDRVGLVDREHTKQIPTTHTFYRNLYDPRPLSDLMAAFVSRNYSEDLPHGETSNRKAGIVAVHDLGHDTGLNDTNRDFTLRNVAGSDEKLSRIPKQRSAEPLKDKAKTVERVFKHTFCRKVSVHFVGAWDTVSSIGFARGESHPDTTSGMSHVCYFRHALALDERRVKFLPEYVCGGASQSNQSGCADEQVYPHTKEVWFPGTHWDIGGLSDKDQENNWLFPPLAWMYMEAGLMGLRLNEDKYHRNLELSRLGTVTKSLNLLWWLVECLPLTRLSYGSDRYAKTRTTKWPHFGQGRKVLPGQLVHESARERKRATECGYISKARFRQIDNKSAKPSFDDAIVEPWGPVGLVHDYRKAGDDQKPALLKKIRDDALTDAGRHGLRQAGVFYALKQLLEQDLHAEDLDTIHAIFDDVYDGSMPERLSYKDVSPLLRLILSDISHRSFRAAHRFITNFTDFAPAHIGTFHRSQDPSPVVSASFWEEKPNRIIAASTDGRIRVWNVGSQTKVLGFQQPEFIKFFTSSPNGKHAVSVSRNGTIYLWDVQQQHLLWQGRMRKGSAGPVKFISKDELVLSAIDDDTLLVWQIRLNDEDSQKYMGSWLDRDPSYEHKLSQGRQHLLDASHLHLLSSLGFSLWSALTSKDVKCAVAFNHTFAAATTTSGITVYAHSDEMVLRLVTTLPAGEGSIKTLAFSHDGNHLIASGEDSRIHVWDTDRWHEKIVLPAHDSDVNGIVVSNDNKRIVSYSEDGTARVWDAENLLQGPQLFESRNVAATPIQRSQ